MSVAFTVVRGRPQHLLLRRSALAYCIYASFIGAVAAVVGCDDRARTYPAGGKVMFKDGEPLTEGWVSFRSLDDPKHVTARGQVQRDGTFNLGTFASNDGAVSGRHRALVVPVARGNRNLPEDNPSGQPTRQFDPRFSSYDSSGFEFVVTDNAAANKFDLIVE